MLEAKVYNLDGKVAETLKLDESVFGLPANDELVHQVFVAQMANKRIVLAHTKNRGERAGSGKKPFPQKGTGQSRVGSVRTPLWKKGGIAFGPRKDRNFKQKINKKMGAKAIATVLSGKLRDQELVIVKDWKLKEAKTKAMAKALANLKVKGSILFGFSEAEKNIRRASRNIPRVTNLLTDQLNVLAMLNHKYLVLSQESVAQLEKKYQKK